MKPLLVGEANPYGGDPEYALYPLPLRASGDRLCTLVMGLERRDYLDRFDRVNLCPERWSAPLSRKNAEIIQRERAGGVVVLLGSKVCAAFGFEYKPFTVTERWYGHGGAAPAAAGSSTRFVLLPHPSGLCRVWNEPDAFRRARAALLAGGVLA